MGIIINRVDDNARLTWITRPANGINPDVVSILGARWMYLNGVRPWQKTSSKGYLALFLGANEPDLESLMEIIKRVPVIESTRGTTLKRFLWRRRQINDKGFKGGILAIVTVDKDKVSCGVPVFLAVDQKEQESWPFPGAYIGWHSS